MTSARTAALRGLCMKRRTGRGRRPGEGIGHLPAGVAWILALLLAVPPSVAAASDGPYLRLATASNFRAAAEALAGSFTATTGWRVSISAGSTGMLYAQIVRGAPFDVFLAADVERPARLEAQQRIVPGSRRPYAVGRLALWGPGLQVTGPGVLGAPEARPLAVADARLAPYGLAARQVLVALGVRDTEGSDLVVGQSIGQAHQFVAAGAAPLGFVALAQVRDRPASEVWLVPAPLHAPIVQEAVQLTARDSSAAFMAFLVGPQAARIIREAGYDLPSGQPATP